MSHNLLYISFGQRFGPKMVAVNLLKELYKVKNFQIYAFVDSGIADLLPLDHMKNVKVIRNRFHLCISLLSILTSLKDKPKICHFNFPPLNPLLTPILLLMRLKKMKIVYSFHGGILVERKYDLLTRWFLFQCRYLYNVIVVNSMFSSKILSQSQKNLEKKIANIPNGVIVDEFIGTTPIVIKGNPSLLYVGRLDAIKGVDILIKAMKHLKNVLPKVCLHVVGEGSEVVKIKKMITTLHLNENVELYGFIPRERLNILYISADIAVVPSRSETFGITVLEGMAAGKPLVVSNRGALPELVKDGYNGIISELTPTSLADSIIRLFKDKTLMKSIAKNNRLRAKFYAWERIVGIYLNMYRLLGN